MRKYARQDSNHKEIRKAFEALGCSVADLSPLGRGVPDLLVGYGGLCIACEVKDSAKPPSARKLTPDEEKFRMTWKGGYRLVENLGHVQETVNVLKGWQLAIYRNLLTTEPLLVAPPEAKGKAESIMIEVQQCPPEFNCPICYPKLNAVCDDYEFDQTRRGD